MGLPRRIRKLVNLVGKQLFENKASDHPMKLMKGGEYHWRFVSALNNGSGKIVA